MTYISDALRQLVIARADNCCEYCLLNQLDHIIPFEIDHVISVKHDGSTDKHNLSWSCPHCNRHKGMDIGSLDPHTRILTPLFNPREQNWDEHFHLNDANIEPLTPEGRVTVFLLKMNSPQVIRERNRLIRLNRYPCK